MNFHEYLTVNCIWLIIQFWLILFSVKMYESFWEELFFVNLKNRRKKSHQKSALYVHKLYENNFCCYFFPHTMIILYSFGYNYYFFVQYRYLVNKFPCKIFKFKTNSKNVSFWTNRCYVSVTLCEIPIANWLYFVH